MWAVVSRSARTARHTKRQLTEFEIESERLAASLEGEGPLDAEGDPTLLAKLGRGLIGERVQYLSELVSADPFSLAGVEPTLNEVRDLATRFERLRAGAPQERPAEQALGRAVKRRATH